MIKIYSSDEKESSLLVETGSYLEAKKLEKELLDAFYNKGGKLEAFQNALLNTWCIDRFFTIAFEPVLYVSTPAPFAFSCMRYRFTSEFMVFWLVIPVRIVFSVLFC